ncbi:MAG: VanZ family protein [Hydrogenophaga sp.]|jgi:VanZ family protein|uniref:VanZ family protein n=1 Tax=Hydrogenophaga sp. TaxID=1904254 RepID=UPI001DC46579|nr:VanZ family protein [Hydrogenophaga sp.]MBW0172189.1 VanZ family protein [Hydrogenophaga sp.]MBW0186124.1 VanZ family protein [Hydrogenophaga sp.]
MRSSILVKAFFWLCLVAITVGSLLPVALLPAQSFNIWDKAQHAVGFGCLAFFALLAYPRDPIRKCAYLLAYGGAIELAQAATGWRYGEWWDLAADGIGIAMGAVAWWVVRRTSRTAY